MQLVWTRRALAAGVVAALAGFVLVPVFAADPPLKAGLPGETAAKQQDADMAFLTAALDKKAKNSVQPVRTTALLIALNAQNRMGTDATLAGVRDQMLKVAAAMQDDDDHKVDWKGAQAAFDAVKGAKGKAEAVKIDSKEYDIGALMNVYKKKERGGRGWEDALAEQSKKATDADLALEIAQASFLIGQLSEQLAPEEKVKTAAKKKQWADFSADMRKLSLDAATEAAKGKKADLAALTKKLDAVNANCNACHGVFKKN